VDNNFGGVMMENSDWIILQLEDRAQIATMMEESNKMAFRNAFLVGAVRRINDRLAEMRKKEAVMSTALTILDTEAKEFAYSKFNVVRGRAWVRLTTQPVTQPVESLVERFHLHHLVSRFTKKGD